MLIYNVTTKADAAIAAVWLQWMQQQHIPAIMATGCFTGHTIVRLLDVDDSDGPTYAVQYKADNKAAYDWYITEHADALRDAAHQKWGSRIISFHTLMEVVQ